MRQPRRKASRNASLLLLDCDKEPIRAHSIQNARVLDLITQTDGHVFMPRYRLVNGEPKMEFAKVGRNEASTFPGLCSKHDTELFKAIDTEPLEVDNCEHRRQLAYRSVNREMHAELENCERAWVIHEEICKAQQADPNEVATQASLLGAQAAPRRALTSSFRRPGSAGGYAPYEPFGCSQTALLTTVPTKPDRRVCPKRRYVRASGLAYAALGIPTSMPETRSVTTNTINPTSLFPDTIPSTTPNREKHPCKMRPQSPICPPRRSFNGSDRDFDHHFAGRTSIQ